MEPVSASVTLYIDIFDQKAMWRHAYAVFEQTNGAADQDDFEDMCGTEEEPDIAACLQMIFDPGKSPPGVQIEDCSAQAETRP